MINVNTGQVKILNLTLQAKLPFQTVLDRMIDFEYELFDFDNGYLTLQIRHVKIGDKLFYFSLSFESKKLRSISFSFMLNEDVEESLSQWNKTEELQKVETYKRWLSEILGTTQRTFSWGNIEAYYDAKGISSGIIVSYYKV
jgi:hypothetical protein